jgi:hypothetical protein
MKKILAAVLALGLIVTLAVALGNSTRNTTNNEPQPGDTAWVQPPSMIDPTNETYTEVNVGNSVVLIVDNAETWTVEITDSSLLEFQPGGDQGTYETYPALIALAEGKTIVTAINTAGERFKFTVNIRAKNDQLWGPESMVLALAEEVIGLPEEKAIELIENKSGMIMYRIVKRDGENFPVTMDYRLDRINLEITEGIVTYAYVG